jgi:hypothetical protein
MTPLFQDTPISASEWHGYPIPVPGIGGLLHCYSGGSAGAMDRCGGPGKGAGKTLGTRLHAIPHFSVVGRTATLHRESRAGFTRNFPGPGFFPVIQGPGFLYHPGFGEKKSVVLPEILKAVGPEGREEYVSILRRAPGSAGGSTSGGCTSRRRWARCTRQQSGQRS